MIVSFILKMVLVDMACNVLSNIEDQQRVELCYLPIFIKIPLWKSH